MSRQRGRFASGIEMARMCATHEPWRPGALVARALVVALIGFAVAACAGQGTPPTDEGATSGETAATPVPVPLPSFDSSSPLAAPRNDRYEGAGSLCKEAEEALSRSVDLAKTIEGPGDKMSLLLTMSSDMQDVSLAEPSHHDGQGADRVRRLAELASDQLDDAAVAVIGTVGGINSSGYASGLLRQAVDALRDLDRFCAHAQGEQISAPSGSADGQGAWPGTRLSQEFRAQVRTDVIQVQGRLNALGYGWLEADGRYGPLTEAAVEIFQQSQSLAVDGIVGPITWARLFDSAGPATEFEGPGNDGLIESDDTSGRGISRPLPRATCVDGTLSYSMHNQGTCSWHGGVDHWN